MELITELRLPDKRNGGASAALRPANAHWIIKFIPISVHRCWWAPRASHTHSVNARCDTTGDTHKCVPRNNSCFLCLAFCKHFHSPTNRIADKYLFMGKFISSFVTLVARVLIAGESGTLIYPLQHGRTASCHWAHRWHFELLLSERIHRSARPIQRECSIELSAKW